MLFFHPFITLACFGLFFPPKLQCFLYGERYKQRKGPFLVLILTAYYLFFLTLETVIVFHSSINICIVVLCVKMDMLVLLLLIAANKRNLHVYLNISVFCCVGRILSCGGTVYRQINMNSCNLIYYVNRRPLY